MKDRENKIEANSNNKIAKRIESEANNTKNNMEAKKNNENRKCDVKTQG